MARSISVRERCAVVGPTEERALAFRDHRLAHPRRVEARPPLAGQGDFDVLLYDLALSLDVAAERIEGRPR